MCVFVCVWCFECTCLCVYARDKINRLTSQIIVESRWVTFFLSAEHTVECIKLFVKAFLHPFQLSDH